MVSPARLCVICKGGRNLCGHSPCPLIPRFRAIPEAGKIKRSFFGPSYSVFVGRFGYPDVNIGPLAAIDEKPNLDSPEKWFGMKYSDIIELRSLLLRSKQKENVKSSSRFVLENQELVLASRPTDVEMSFRKRPVYTVSFSDVVQPMGPSAPLERMRVAENPKIHSKVEKIVSDDIKAEHAGFLLYSTGQDVHRISSILSSGVLGIKKSKKLVPTRWSITAVDDMIFRRLAADVRGFPSVDEYMVYSSFYLDNRFEILLMPGSWEYEDFEAWAPGSVWTSKLKKPEILEEYEPFSGRTSYADKEGGGYYAARLGVIEGLHRMRRQARVVVFREIYEGYVIPLGVWQVRENVRNAFRKPCKKFSTLGEALKDIESRLRLPLNEYRKISRILKQKRLTDF